LLLLELFISLRTRWSAEAIRNSLFHFFKRKNNNIQIVLKMKKTALLFCLLSFHLAFPQALPFDFESASTNPSFVDFDGGVATITTNPLSAGINTSNSVAQIVRNGGAIWAGSKIILASNLSFSVLTKISMKVYTTAAIGTVVKLKLEGTGPSVEVDAYTTVSGNWETLEWVFAGTPNNLNEVVFMFDFGTVGNGTANSTFYFDDLEQVQGPTAPQLLSLPIDFENGTVSSDFLNFSGGMTSVIANPVKMGINSSDTVAQIIRNGGDIWAGSKILLNSNLDLSSMWHISMKFYTTAPIGTRVKLQLEEPTGTYSLDVLTTVSGAWETLNWNFYGQSSTFDRIAFLFDFGQIGDGSANSTFLFDDIQQVVGPAPLPPVPAALPIDFESSVLSSDFINQFGAITTIVPNPLVGGINTSATVAQFLKSGGQVWARSLLELNNNIDFSNLSAITMKVYTEAPVGTTLKLKVESTNSGAANEKDVVTTVSGAWASYTWDFTGDPPVYNVLTFMYGYGTIGDASPTSTFYIDDIVQTNTSGSIGIESAALEQGVEVFPNPANDYITLSSETAKMEVVSLFDFMGNQVLEAHPDSHKTTLSISNLASGVYIAIVSTKDGLSKLKLSVD
jgi:hypothetical protein